MLDETLLRRNECVMQKLQAWAGLLDEAGWCVALRMPDDQGFWLSEQAKKDLQQCKHVWSSWPDLVMVLKKLPKSVVACQCDGIMIWSHINEPDSVPFPPHSGAVLTPREAEVMSWLGEGKSSSEIAIILGCKARTVEKHVANLYRKIGVRNRASAILKTKELQT